MTPAEAQAEILLAVTMSRAHLRRALLISDEHSVLKYVQGARIELAVEALTKFLESKEW